MNSIQRWLLIRRAKRLTRTIEARIIECHDAQDQLLRMLDHIVRFG